MAQPEAVLACPRRCWSRSISGRKCAVAEARRGNRSGFTRLADVCAARVRALLVSSGCSSLFPQRRRSALSPASHRALPDELALSRPLGAKEPITSSPRQLAFRWPHSPSFAREDFLLAPSNRDALAAIELWPNWASRMLMLVGPEGAGKSHLGAIWARAAGAISLAGEDLDELTLEACAQASAVLIEDADRARGAEALFFT